MAHHSDSIFPSLIHSYLASQGTDGPPNEAPKWGYGLSGQRRVITAMDRRKKDNQNKWIQFPNHQKEEFRHQIYRFSRYASDHLVV